MSEFKEMVDMIQWRELRHETPSNNEEVWYYNKHIGYHRGYYKGDSQFVSTCGTYTITNEVTHWQPDFGQNVTTGPYVRQKIYDYSA